MKQQRPLHSDLRVTTQPSRRSPFPIAPFRSCDQNRIMAAAAAVRSSVRLTFRLSRIIPDLTLCPLNRLQSCVVNLQNAGSSESFRTINRHLQTSKGEWRALLTRRTSRRGWFLSLFTRCVQELALYVVLNSRLCVSVYSSEVQTIKGCQKF